VSADARLRVAAATKVYADRGDTAVEALRGVDLEVAPGEFVAVTGPSGCGKSTLLHLLGGLDVATSGEVYLDGVAVSSLSRTSLAALRNRRVGFVFQAFHLLPAMSAYDNVTLPAVLAGERPRDYHRRALELLDAVGLGGRADRLPSQLSGGEQQRVAIARALVMSPAVLLADEPTGNLDTEMGNDIVRLIREQHGTGQTVVLVTHDLKIASHAERVAFMRDGLIVSDAGLPKTSGAARSTLQRLVQASAEGRDLIG
jgi:putative ABC transport system ATP-binding protein